MAGLWNMARVTGPLRLLKLMRQRSRPLRRSSTATISPVAALSVPGTTWLPLSWALKALSSGSRCGACWPGVTITGGAVRMGALPHAASSTAAATAKAPPRARDGKTVGFTGLVSAVWLGMRGTYHRPPRSRPPLTSGYRPRLSPPRKATQRTSRSCPRISPAG